VPDAIVWAAVAAAAMLEAVVAVGVRLARMSCAVVTVLVSKSVGILPATVLAVAAESSVSMLWSRGDPVPVMVRASSADHTPFNFSVRESFNWSLSVQISFIAESSSLLSGLSVVVVRDLNIFFTAVLAGESGAFGADCGRGCGLYGLYGRGLGHVHGVVRLWSF
jgi:hypothetical protein